MKLLFPILSIILLFFGCSSPQKLIEQGSYDRAFEQSLKKLKGGKVKSDDLYILEQSFTFLNNHDRDLIEDLIQKNQPEDWPVIYENALKVGDRQNLLAPVYSRLSNLGHTPQIEFYPVEDLLVEAQEKSAIYNYARAQEFLPSARKGDRKAAREAYSWLEKAQGYRHNFRNSEELISEMRDLGTDHVLLLPILDTWDEYLSGVLFESLLWNKKFPFREDWRIYHIHQPEASNIHYRLELFFEDLQATGNEIYTDNCVSQAEIENGFVDKMEWSERDSAFIEIREPIYATVTAYITTYEQFKGAQVTLKYQLIDQVTDELIKRRRFTESSDWRNAYSVWSGDERALNGSCQDFGDYISDYPDTEELFIDAVQQMRWSFFRALE